MQSLLTAIYPILKENYGLDFVQIGLLTFTFQVTASLLQPAIGMFTDKRPMPYSLPVGMGSSLIGLIVLGFAQSYGLLLLGSALVGIGSAIFHPESSRVARLASGGRHGLAQALFQVGGNVGLGDRTAARSVHRPAARPGQRRAGSRPARSSASSSSGGSATGTPRIAAPTPAKARSARCCPSTGGRR